jgi:uncharacterized membrane protein YadS
MNQVQNAHSRQRRVDVKPWYKQFWPWFIIALPLVSVVASFVTLWLAISKPDYEVLNAEQLQLLNKGLKAQPAMPANPQPAAGQPDPDAN